MRTGVGELSDIAGPAAWLSLLQAPSGGCVGKRRGALPADDGRRLLDEVVVLEGLDHEECEVHAAGDVALEDRVADMPAPDRKPLAVVLLEVAAAYDGPASVAGEDAPAGFHLVVEVGEACEAREATADVDECLQPPRVDVLAVAGDVPSAREHEPCPRLGVVEDGLGGCGGVPVDSPRHEPASARRPARRGRHPTVPT